MIGKLVKEERPMQAFGVASLVLALSSLLLATPLIMTYIDTGLVPRLPTAVLAAALMILSFLALTCGLILDSVTRARREAKRLAYLAHPAPGLSP